MQKVGGRAYFSRQVLGQIFGALHVFGESRIILCVLANLGKLQAEGGQCLSGAIVQFPRNVPPLGILRLQKPRRKVTQFRVSSFKFLSAKLDLGVERILQCSITSLALAQFPLNPFTLGDVPSNF